MRKNIRETNYRRLLLFSAIVINIVRDVAWTYLSCEDYNDRLKKTNNAGFGWNGQWFGQQLWSTLFMIMASLTLLVGTITWEACPEYEEQTALINENRQHHDDDQALVQPERIDRIPFSFKEYCIYVFSYFIAAAIAIYTWDRGQTLGINLGLSTGMTPAQSGYFASLLTGSFEGPTQFFFIALILMMFHEKTRKEVQNNSKTFFKTKSQESLLSIFPGMIPGALWQIVYNAGSTEEWPVSATCVGVGVTVALANFFVDRLNSKILRLPGIDPHRVASLQNATSHVEV